MINQINNSADKNVFAPLRSSGATFAITKPFTTEQKQDGEFANEKKSNAFGYGIAVSALVVGFGVFAAMNGMPKIARHKINKFFRYLDDKITKMNKNKDKSFIQSAYLTLLKGAKSITKKSKTLFNAAPLKDAAVVHWLEKAPMLKKWSEKITEVFEKISVKTSKNAYSKTLVKFDTMYADFAKANSKIDAKQAELINEKIASIKLKYGEGFGEAARNQRLIETKKDMEGIDKKVYKSTWGNLKGYALDKKTYETYISEELASPAKMKLINKVNNLKEEISISPNDNYMSTRKLLNNIYDFVDQADETPRMIMKSLKKDLAGYKKALENGAKAEEAFPETAIGVNLADLEKYFNEASKYDVKTKTEALEYINNLKSVLRENKKGEIQEIMEIYKKAGLPEDDFKKLNSSVNKTLKSFNHSIDMETDKLFDKVRDLLIGAAPVDVLSVISSLGVVGWGLSKAENKDERISAALKFGIPAVGGVAISLYCTVGLVAGGPALIIGILSGMAINKLGVVVDNARKKYKEKPPTLSIPDPSKILPAIKEKAITPSAQNKPAL